MKGYTIMATKIVVQALAALFGADVVIAIGEALTAIVGATLRGAEKWEYIVGLYHDGQTANLDKKRSLSAAFKVEANAKGYSDDSAKSMFSSGTSKAEIALGYKVMPTAGAKSTKKVTPKATAAPTAGATGADVVGAAFTLEISAMARELADRVAHFMTHEKVNKSATEAIGKIAELLGAMNVKLGNVPSAS